MGVRKEASIIYVAPMTAGDSGIRKAVPAHFKVQWHDDLGRRCSFILDLPEDEVAKLAQELPDSRSNHEKSSLKKLEDLSKLDDDRSHFSKRMQAGDDDDW